LFHILVPTITSGFMIYLHWLPHVCFYTYLITLTTIQNDYTAGVSGSHEQLGFASF
jgi:hypothetical protein